MLHTCRLVPQAPCRSRSHSCPGRSSCRSCTRTGGSCSARVRHFRSSRHCRWGRLRRRPHRCRRCPALLRHSRWRSLPGRSTCRWCSRTGGLRCGPALGFRSSHHCQLGSLQCHLGRCHQTQEQQLRSPPRTHQGRCTRRSCRRTDGRQSGPVRCRRSSHRCRWGTCLEPGSRPKRRPLGRRTARTVALGRSHA